MDGRRLVRLLVQHNLADLPDTVPPPPSVEKPVVSDRSPLMQFVHRFLSWSWNTFRSRGAKGKLGIGCASLLAVLFACSIPIAILSPSEKPTPTVQSAAKPEPTSTAVPKATVEPTNTAAPKATQAPAKTRAPTGTTEPTETATPIPADTSAPTPTAAVTTVEAEVIEIVGGDRGAGVCSTATRGAGVSIVRGYLGAPALVCHACCRQHDGGVPDRIYAAGSKSILAAILDGDVRACGCAGCGHFLADNALVGQRHALGSPAQAGARD